MKQRSLALILAVFLAAQVAWTQSVTMETKPLTVTPNAAVGGKIRLRWTVQKQTGVLLQVLNAAGKCVRTLDAGNMAPDDYNFIFDGCDAAGKVLPAGAYTLRLSATPRVEADLTFGAGGMLGQIARTFTFEKDRKFNLGVKGINAKMVTVKVDGETWEQEEDFLLAGNNYKVDAAAGTVEFNPTGTLDKGAEIIISFAQGLPLENPYAIKTAPDGSLYIADFLGILDGLNKRPKPRTGSIYKVDAAGKPILTFAKNGILALDGKDLAVDADGNLYVVPLYHTIFVYDSLGKPRYNVAGYIDPNKIDKDHPIHGGYWPGGIALNEARRMVMVNADQTNVLYDATKPDFTGFIACQSGKEGAELPPAFGPSLAAQGDFFYATTYYNRLIKYHFDPATKDFSIVWTTPVLIGGPDAKFTGQDQLWNALGIELDGTGLIYVADRSNHRIQIFFDAGTSYKYVGSLGSEGTAVDKCQLMAPHAITLSPDRKSLYVADDGIFLKSGNTPVVKGLARVVKWKLGAGEMVETKLVVK